MESYILAVTTFFYLASHLFILSEIALLQEQELKLPAKDVETVE